MTRFAFVVHPLEARDAARKYPMFRYLPDGWVEALLRFKRPGVVSHITGVRSATGAETEGWFIGCPLTSRQLVTMPPEAVYPVLVECARLGAEQGADLIGLGAFTSVAGDGGVTVAHQAPIAVTTGNSYTVATAIEGTLRACDMVGIPLDDSVLAVVGATGSIGRTCATMMASSFRRTILVGRDEERTREAARALPRSEATTRVPDITVADVVVTVTSADTPVIEPGHLRPGAIVCDVARPRDVSVRVAKERHDVLVIEGGVVRVPGEVEFGFDFGFPDRTAYACMAETMILALEGRADSFTLGKSVSVTQVQEISRLAQRHGFELAGFRSFERAVEPEAIERARRARESLAAV